MGRVTRSRSRSRGRSSSSTSKETVNAGVTLMMEELGVAATPRVKGAKKSAVGRGSRMKEVIAQKGRKGSVEEQGQSASASGEGRKSRKRTKSTDLSFQKAKRRPSTAQPLKKMQAAELSQSQSGIPGAEVEASDSDEEESSSLEQQIRAKREELAKAVEHLTVVHQELTVLEGKSALRLEKKVEKSGMTSVVGDAISGVSTAGPSQSQNRGSQDRGGVTQTDNRGAPESDSDPDSDFVVPRRSSTAKVPRSKKVVPRKSDKLQKVADDLPFFRPPRTHAKEREQFFDFMEGVKKFASGFKNKGTWLFENDHAIWIATICRFTDGAEQSAAIARSPTNAKFLKNYNGSPYTVTKAMPRVLNKGKPICVVVGEMPEEMNDAQLLVLNWTTKEAWVKESRQLNKATVMTPTYEILASLKINQVQLVAELPKEVTVYDKDYLKECYKYVAEILDGNPFWMDDNFLDPEMRRQFTRDFSVPDKKRIPRKRKQSL